MPKRSELRITKRTVDALTVDAKETLFWDRDLAGFGVRVHATGRKVDVVQSRGPKGLKRVTVGRHGDISTQERRKQAAVVIDRIKRGEDPVPAPPALELSVADLAERFMRLDVKVHCKPSTPPPQAIPRHCDELETFAAVAESGRIVAAADRLGMTRLALTRTIARAWKEFRGKLFEHIPNGVRLKRPVEGVALPPTPRSGLRPSCRRFVTKAQAPDIKRRRLQAQHWLQPEGWAARVATRRSHCGAPGHNCGASKSADPDFQPH